jgi:hypothetical protein
MSVVASNSSVGYFPKAKGETWTKANSYKKKSGIVPIAIPIARLPLQAGGCANKKLRTPGQPELLQNRFWPD